MTILQQASSHRSMTGLRLAAVTCLGLMILGLGASLVVTLPETGAQLWPLVPMITAGLGTAAAALFLSGKAKQPRIASGMALSVQAEGSESSSILVELRALLEQQRTELAGFRESCNSMTRDALAVGVQLAGFALDAQARLTTSVESAERALTQPSSASNGDADLAQRLEWTMPETLAAALASAADATVKSFDAAAAEATSQIAALGDAAANLRRDAAALNQAGREIATTGAQAVMRAVEAVGAVTSVASSLPEAAATVTAAAKQAVDTMTLAASVLCADSGSLHASAQEAEETVATLQSEAASLRAAGEMIAQNVAEAGAAINASLSGLPQLQAAMGAQATQMVSETEALREVARGAAAAGETLAISASRSAAVLATLPEMTGSLTTATLDLREGMSDLKTLSTGLVESGTALATRVENASGTIMAALPAVSDAILLGCRSLEQQVDIARQCATSITAAGDDAARVLATEAARTQVGGQSLVDALSQLLTQAEGLRELAASGPVAAASLHETALVMISEVAFAGAALRSDAQQLGASGAEAAKATWELRHQASLLHDAGRTLETGAKEAADHVRHITQASVGEIVEAGQRITATLARADASVEAIETAGRSVSTAGDEASARMAQLATICAHAEAQAALLPHLAHQIGSVAEWLQTAAQAMPSAEMLGHVMQALAPIEALASEIKGLPAFTSSLEQIVRSHAAPAVASEDWPASIAPLRHLGGVEREAAALMAESEALAEAVLSGRTADVPAWLHGRTAEVLSAVNTTIHRLRSVATAVALASDAMIGSKPCQVANQS